MCVSSGVILFFHLGGRVNGCRGIRLGEGVRMGGDEGFRSGKRWTWMEIFVFLRYLLFPLETVLRFFSSFPSASRGERISSSKLVKFNQIGLIFYRV